MTETAAGQATGSRVVTALENLWRAIRTRHAELPDVVIVTGSSRGQASSSARWDTLGSFGAVGWELPPVDADGRQIGAPQLFMAGELLDRLVDEHPGRRVLETMLHEGAHALAEVRKVQDTSRGGRYHNRRFAALAVELGLAAPASSSVIGWSDCTLPDTTADLYAEELAELEAAVPAWRVDLHGRLSLPAAVFEDDGPDGDEDRVEGAGGDDAVEAPVAEPEPITRDGTRVSVACECAAPRRISITYGQLDLGPIICGLCGSAFLPPDMDRDAVAAALGEDDEDQADAGDGGS